MVNDDSPLNGDDAAKAAEARRAIQESLTALESAMWRQGFDAGFKTGWKAATERLREVIEKSAQRSDRPETNSPPAPQLEFTLVQPQASKTKAADVVLQIIQQQPGIRGVDIVRAAADIGRPLLERTTRTALYRMKREGQIKNLEGRWFAADAVPEGDEADHGGENDG